MKKIFLLATASMFSALTQAQTFTLQSNDVGGQATATQVFNSFGCTGKNISPQLQWANAPQGTKSFAITMYDKDAPTGSGWWHWVMFDIPATITQLKAGAGKADTAIAPKGSVQSITDFGGMGYGGPCPPEGHGIHQYVITVYALKNEKLGLDKNATPALAGYYLNANAIEKASIIMYYKR